jgi:hypothetical protein
MDTILLTALATLASSIITATLSHWLMLKQLGQQKAQDNRGIFLEKHIEACTKFWSLLGPTSKYIGENRMLKENGDVTYLDVKVTRQFCQDITLFFFSEHGIFMSREFRKALFDTRTFLDKLLSEAQAPPLDLLPLSRTKADKIEDCFRWLRETVRSEVVVKDLHFSRKEVGVKS